MPGRRDESLLLDDLVDAARRLLELGAGDTSLGTERDRDEAVLFNLIVLGEAAKRLSAKTRGRFADIPWADMAETRDRVVHHYEGIDWEVIAEILEKDLPPLLPRLLQVREQLASTP